MGGVSDILTTVFNPIVAQAQFVTDQALGAILPEPPSTSITKQDMPVPGAPATEATFNPGISDSLQKAKKKASLKAGKKQFSSPLVVGTNTAKPSGTPTGTGLKV